MEFSTFQPVFFPQLLKPLLPDCTDSINNKQTKKPKTFLVCFYVWDWRNNDESGRPSSCLQGAYHQVGEMNQIIIQARISARNGKYRAPWNQGTLQGGLGQWYWSQALSEGWGDKKKGGQPGSKQRKPCGQRSQRADLSLQLCRMPGGKVHIRGAQLIFFNENKQAKEQQLLSSLKW